MGEILLVNARGGGLALAVGSTFRSASAVALRIAVEARSAGADGIPAGTNFAVGIGAAWTWRTRLGHCWSFNKNWIIIKSN